MQAVLQEELKHEPGDLEREAYEILERFVAEAKAEGVEARQKLAFGSPWQQICRQVLAEKHDLVVVGTRDVGPYRPHSLRLDRDQALAQLPVPRVGHPP